MGVAAFYPNSTAALRQKMTKAEQANALTLSDYVSRIRLLALALYEWQGLPDTVNVRYLERALFEEGRCLFFRDKSGLSTEFMALRCTDNGMLNFYNEPTAYRAVSINYNHEYKPEECVLIRNNVDMLPTASMVSLYAQRLTEAERTIDVNIKQQKIPLIILCSDEQRLSMLNLFRKVDGNEPVIFGDKDTMLLENIKSLKTDAPYLVDKLMLYKHDLMNECMTTLGINNANTDKKERLITDEANANNQQIMTFAQIGLMARQEAAEQINKVFGLSVSCRLRQPPQNDIMIDDQDSQEGSQDDGQEGGEQGNE